MLRLEKTKESSYDIIHLHGEVDASNSVELDQVIKDLIESGSKMILVDGSQLEYISSAGLGVFMSYLEDFQEQDIRFKISDLNPKVFEVFKILGLDQLIPIYTTKSEALAS